MSKRNLSLTAAQGADSNITAQLFFANGYANPIAFLDSYQSLMVNGRKKSAKLWDGLRTNRPINNILTVLTDDKGIQYTWAEMQWSRSKILFRVTLFAPKMVELLELYQDGKVNIKCSLQELLDEATRLEDQAV